MPAGLRLTERAGPDGRDSSPTAILNELDELSDDELDAWIVQHRGPVFHLVGSCRMGEEGASGSVTVAEAGRSGTLPGLEGVVVADASLFPDLVAGGLQMPIVAVAERVAAETLLATS